MRLIRAGLWLVLMGLPLLYCGLAVVCDAVSQAMRLPAAPADKRTAVVLAAIEAYGWPVLLAALAVGVLLVLGALVVRRFSLGWLVPAGASAEIRLGRQLLALLVLAYLLGTLVHVGLPASLFHTPVSTTLSCMGLGEQYG